MSYQIILYIIINFNNVTNQFILVHVAIFQYGQYSYNKSSRLETKERIKI